MTTRDEIERTLGWALDRVPTAELRVVGTAASALRGIDLEVGDIDVLFAERRAIDAWFAVLSPEATVVEAPTWLASSQQYFSRIRVHDLRLELSTVEGQVDDDTFECQGIGPWRHFDEVPCGRHTVPIVATELRLLSELARGRHDRAAAIQHYLDDHEHNADLLTRGRARLS